MAPLEAGCAASRALRTERGSLRLVAALALCAGACQDAIVVGHAGVDEVSEPPALRPEAEAGLLGQYWDNLELSGPVALERVDGAEEVWEDAPGPGVSEVFSARFRGFLLAETAGTRSLRLDSDDGSRLWLDGQLVFDQWRGAPNSATSEVTLDPARPSLLELELYSLGGVASFHLLWQSQEGTYETIPLTRLRVP